MKIIFEKSRTTIHVEFIKGGATISPSKLRESIWSKIYPEPISAYAEGL